MCVGFEVELSASDAHRLQPQLTNVLIIGEFGDVHEAGTFEYTVWCPEHLTSMLHLDQTSSLFYFSVSPVWNKGLLVYNYCIHVYHHVTFV